MNIISRVVWGKKIISNCQSKIIPVINFISIEGEHPRIGTLDVCPFIPVRGATMDDCVKCSEEFADKLSKEFNVPGN